MARGAWGGLVLLVAILVGTTGLARSRIEVEVTPGADGLRAAYRLPAPVKRFTFAEDVDDVRGDTWHPPADMTLSKGRLARKDGRPFQTFAIDITPDTAPRDRRYPALTRVGEGWQVYGPYFFAAKGQGEVVARLARPRGWTVAPASKGGADALPLGGSFFVGPAAYVTRGAFVLVAAPSVEAGTRARISKAAGQATTFYAARLGVGLPVAPTVITTRVPQFQFGWQGDTTDGPVASLRFFGEARADVDIDRQVTHFVDHEFFHFWNGRLFHSRDGDHEAWLHEGMAEYAALLATRDSGDRSEAQVGEELSRRLTGCAKTLESKGLSIDPPRKGRGVYDCGVLVQWIADLKVRAATHGRDDVFDVWRGLFAAARARGGEYDGAGFLAAAGLSDGADDPLRLLMRPGDADRWTRLTSALGGLGAKVTPIRSPQAEREQLVFHLLAQVCEGSQGFYGGDPKALKLDTGDRCGVLNGDPTVDAVAGHDLMTDALAARDAAAAICDAKGEVAFTYQGKPVATLVCKTAMPPRPLAWTVEAWRQGGRVAAGPSTGQARVLNPERPD